MPKVYSVKEHHIQAKRVNRHAYYIIEKLRQAGFIAYLVGGSVRDLLLNQKPKDFDIATSAKPEEIKAIFKRNCILIGRRFRLAHIRFGRKIVEIATFRSGDIQSTDLILSDNIFGTPEDDAIRRDFTINGLFYNPENETIIDYVGGVVDAHNKTIRTIGNSEMRFKQDPVRMIRLLKFKARFNFKIEEETLNALYNCRNEILKSSKARILEELFRMLESGASKEFFFCLFEYGFLQLLMPHLAKHFEKHQNSPIFTYLEKADNISLKIFPETIYRSILLSCIFFPIIEQKNIEKSRLVSEIRFLMNNIFSNFLHIPKKLKSDVTSIIFYQFHYFTLAYRKKIKIPKDKTFLLALKFLKLRCMIDEKLLPIFNMWQEEYMKKQQHIHHDI
jgi:poly(A) polymerase